MFGSGICGLNIHMPVRDMCALVRDTLFQTRFAFGLSRLQESTFYGREVLDTIRLLTGFYETKLIDPNIYNR
jgi:hypothetical protein